jgi:hypothetical protein
MKRLLCAAALTLLGLGSGFSPASAATISNLGVNPTSASGAFSNTVFGGLFTDDYLFQLVGGPQFITIASATNVFPQASDFITNFAASVFSYGANNIYEAGGGDDVSVIGPVLASLGCGPIPNCQGLAASAILGVGNYYAQISGTGGGTSGYGGNIAVAPVPIPPALALFATAIAGLVGLRRRRKATDA